jgi:hypothetical protein
MSQAQRVQLIVDFVNAGIAMVKNLGEFGRNYSRQLVRNFQVASNAAVSVLNHWSPEIELPVYRLVEDGIYGPKTRGMLLKGAILPASIPPIPELPGLVPTWYRANKAAINVYTTSLVQRLTQRLSTLPSTPSAATPPASAAPIAEASAAAQIEAAQAQALEAQAQAQEPPPPPPPLEPPPAASPPPPAPTSSQTPSRTPQPLVLEMDPIHIWGDAPRQPKSTGAPWLAIGLGVLVLGGILGYAFLGSKKRS